MLPITSDELLRSHWHKDDNLERLLLSRGYPVGSQIYFTYYSHSNAFDAVIVVVISATQFSLFLYFFDSPKQIIAFLTKYGELPQREVEIPEVSFTNRGWKKSIYQSM